MTRLSIGALRRSPQEQRKSEGYNAMVWANPGNQDVSFLNQMLATKCSDMQVLLGQKGKWGQYSQNQISTHSQYIKTLSKHR